MNEIYFYSISRILQRQFDEEESGVVINSIHPGTKHSKIQQQSVIPLEVGVRTVHTLFITFLCIHGPVLFL